MVTDLYRRILEEVSAGTMAVEDALARLGAAPFEASGTLRLDPHRALRTGVPEAILAEGKTRDQVLHALDVLARAESGVLVTRVARDLAPLLEQRYARGVWHEAARIFEVPPAHPLSPEGQVVVVSAGAADQSVAEEAIVTARALGAQVDAIFDAGVAGVHRLLAERELLARARAVVAVAGMDGALPSVVGGLVSGVVVAVPTSTGYGASFGGLAALLTMLNSCAPGVVVVNIDNGYGAGVAAARINHVSSRAAVQGAKPIGERP
jgi:NCAIR mutase (PurE)-related protein